MATTGMMREMGSELAFSSLLSVGLKPSCELPLPLLRDSGAAVAAERRFIFRVDAFGRGSVILSHGPLI